MVAKQSPFLQIPLMVFPNAKGLDLPSYATDGSAGVDLRAAISDELLLQRNERKLIPTGVGIALPVGYNAEIRSRSGLAYKNGVMVLNSPGTVDSDYRGELMVLLMNLGEESFRVERGMRIAQMVIIKHETVVWKEVNVLEDTSRSTGGYGSTGVK
ncbi:MAG: dUTP diphosphatase [Holosporaceae bacterium]|jgi:dUTP pyrophosphatase|nr:dUTP diphosphatase [Holosporaceae bacterium]